MDVQSINKIDFGVIQYVSRDVVVSWDPYIRWIVQLYWRLWRAQTLSELSL
jgi:hypothetical protein